MAINPQTHFRSISFPSKFNQINPTNYEPQLQKLKSCDQNTSIITSQTIQSSLLNLAELYNSMQQLTHVQSQITHHQSIEESLSHSVELLDACSSIRDIFQMIKENVHTLQSALRRKGLDETSVKNDVASYFCSRKRMNKSIAKTLKTLKNLENNKLYNSNILALTVDVLKSALVYLTWPAGKSGGWNLISRLMISTKSMDKDINSGVISEVGCVDYALNAIRNGESKKVVDVALVQRCLQKLNDCVEGIEGGLEKLFRQLLKSRVTLLNILTDH